MKVIIPRKDVECKNLKVENTKKFYGNISTTFAGCYLIENINNKNICIVFDRGLAY
jgi:hypothetical protein